MSYTCKPEAEGKKGRTRRLPVALCDSGSIVSRTGGSPMDVVLDVLGAVRLGLSSPCPGNARGRRSYLHPSPRTSEDQPEVLPMECDDILTNNPKGDHWISGNGDT